MRKNQLSFEEICAEIDGVVRYCFFLSFLAGIVVGVLLAPHLG